MSNFFVGGNATLEIGGITLPVQDFEIRLDATPDHDFFDQSLWESRSGVEWVLRQTRNRSKKAADRARLRRNRAQRQARKQQRLFAR